MAGVVALGECMVELGLAGSGEARVGYAGDTFNTAVYLRRLGQAVAYVTAVGAGDPFSSGMMELMAREGVAADLVVQVPGRLPGLYAVERDAAGERRFFYWRNEAPVRRLFELLDLAALRAALRGAALIYLSGVTLAVVGEAGRTILLDLLAEAHAAGAPVAFDANYRASLWPSPQAARGAVEAIVPLCRYVSFSAEDVAVYAEPADAVAQRWAALGAEVVRRDEDLRVVVHRAGGTMEASAEAPAGPVVDTTGAGDSFNAAYLAARMAGRSPIEAVAAGRRLAAAVIRRPGAIIPPDAMPRLEL